MIRLRLKKGRETSVERHHPWLFSGGIASEEGDGADGLAEVLDSQERVRAHGSYSPGSQIVARLWTFDGRVPDRALLLERFEAARRLRESVLPPRTTGYRAVNSEGDLCPGILLDIYGGVAVLDLLTGGVEKWEEDTVSAVNSVFHPEELLVRRTGSERDRGASKSEIRTSKSEIRLVPFFENGLRFFADVASGQKTGFFLDQRDNRMRLGALSKGRTALNLFSYSGAFSVAALAGGAKRAVDVDSSEAALDLAREHRRANGLRAEEADFVRADVFDDLRRRASAEERWDIVVCDPPAFAKKRGDVAGAARGYKEINRLAMSLVKPGGFLLTCSCSGHVDADLFQKIVFSAALDAGASFSITARQGAGADHPVSLECPEGEYLKGLWLSRAI
ncbi:MAG TPA: class I SAM-dependent rRNA methyltransferase [Thermoanaerobaculia bacterium]|nr:class I SAM-dependent rRNA methyltransferase [Thermoanaerobaculia bacterium]